MDSSIYIELMLVFGVCFVATFVAAGVIMGFWLATLNSMLHFGKEMIIKQVELVQLKATEQNKQERPPD